MSREDNDRPTVPRRVDRIPLDYLWEGSDTLPFSRQECLGTEELKSLLKTGSIQFYVANVGDPLVKIELPECYTFWKKVRPNVVDCPDSVFHLEDFPGEFVYLASKWQGEFNVPVVLLEMYH